jgi:hypothetical protein
VLITTELRFSPLGFPFGSRVANDIFFHDPLQSLFRPARGASCEPEAKPSRGNGRKSEKKKKNREVIEIFSATGMRCFVSVRLRFVLDFIQSIMFCKCGALLLVSAVVCLGRVIGREYGKIEQVQRRLYLDIFNPRLPDGAPPPHSVLQFNLAPCILIQEQCMRTYRVILPRM